MAKFDLTSKMTKYLDRHLVAPLLEFLWAKKASISTMALKIFLSGRSAFIEPFPSKSTDICKFTAPLLNFCHFVLLTRDIINVPSIGRVVV